ncbi:transcriptional regulator [Acinetobacter courvalinii]|uniref:transcriptional regulator n=1 Tax=Acinetobacter courvalinii TaxID=280147 RepID=UPI0021CF970E|nr:winged helix-turn-helix domain-containing protein [Acinetobacter courvalinii]MCU4369593.1 winged helix-turn-helix domain-containing protein [Acinetobacter courvalinii]MCU4447798.1 winged helix-turn-helix domain-containing protein [Acinetobacter courvalinii]
MAQKQINDHLIFDDISRDLISLKLKNKKVTLGQAAAFCLDCLIAAQGDVVSQETLIEEGWRKHGFEVSTGNVRQVISQLRRAFSQLKESPDILITVHKLGYRLQVELATAPIEEVQTDLVEAEVNESDAKSEVIFADDRIITPAPKVKPYKTKTPYFIWAGILFLNAVIAISYFFMTSGSSLPQVRYQSFSDPLIKDKQLFVDQRLLDKPEFINYSLTLLMKSPFWEKDRPRYSWLYLNASADPKIRSFFLCDKAITEQPVQCISRVFVEE